MTPAELLDHPLVAERYFFPRSDAPERPWIVDVPGARLACARVGRRGRKALLHFHGNGEVVCDWLGDFGAGIAAGGLDAYFAEYRGYGASGGRPALATMLDDALAIADATGVAPKDLVVYGRSVGSLYALHVAAHRGVGALVLESGIADVLERVRIRVRASELGVSDDGLREAVTTLFDQRAKIARTSCPVLVLHAKNDTTVLPRHAVIFAEWAGARAQLVLFERGNHNSIHAFNGDAIVRRVLELAGS